jgi:hypothetical protein
MTSESEPKQVKVGYTYPPDYVWKNRQTHQAPAKAISQGMGYTYIPDHAEYIKGKGTFVYYKGYKDQPPPKFPSRNVAPEDAVYAVAGVKRNLLAVLRFLGTKEMRWVLGFVALGTRKWQTRLLTNALNEFNASSEVLLYPFYLNEDYYCEVGSEIGNATIEFLTTLGIREETAQKTGEIVATMIEFDNVYRWRLQDTMGYARKDDMLYNFPSEVERLLKIEASHEVHADMAPKFSSIGKMLKLAWKIPRIKKALQVSIQSIDFDKCKLDEGEIYHTILYDGYQTQGRTLDERIKLYETYHGTYRSKWPPRGRVELKT